ncbi:MAG: pyrimidine 5'-nucleotidase [Pseudomonadota bacterium]
MQTRPVPGGRDPKPAPLQRARPQATATGMIASTFTETRTWVFDLDNTLYPATADLFPQIEARIGAFIQNALGLDAQRAADLRHRYWLTHGTTLAGLTQNHGIAPEAFLHEVHDIDLSDIGPDPALTAGLAALPGRRVVFTNGSRAHAHRVTRARGIADLFDAVYGIEDAGFVPKPQAPAFDAVFTAEGLEPRTAAMFEDEPRNLVEPHRRGLRTVHVAPSPAPAPHIDHGTDDLAGFLSHLGEPPSRTRATAIHLAHDKDRS